MKHLAFLPGVVGLLVVPALFVPALLAGPSNTLMDISRDGNLLVCSNRDSGTVTIIGLSDHQKLHEIPVGKKPEGVTFVGGSHQVAVAVYGDDRIVFVDADSGKIEASLDVFDEPYGIVTTRDGQKLFTSLDYPGRVLEIDVASRKVTRDMSAGQFVRGMAISADELRLYVTEYYRAGLASLDLASGTIERRWDGADTDNLGRQIVVHPSRPKVYMPHIRSRVKSNHGDGAIFPYVSVFDTEGDTTQRKRIPMDAFVGNLVTSNPWEAALSPDGKQFYVVFAGTNDMFACAVLDDNYRELQNVRYLRLGNNPRAVCVSPDSRRFYVYNALDFNVVAYDAQQFTPLATVAVCDCPLSGEVQEGKILFYSALQPMVGRRWISCASCHPDGDSDGRVWKNPEGLRNTQSLAGLAWTHPIHWSADRDEVQDFEHTIRGQLMQGKGLIQGSVQDSLGTINKGLSRELDCLAEYTNSHTFPLSPHAKGGLSESAQRGRDLFFSNETRCATCHSGPFYTDSRPRAAAEIVRHDVGTGSDDETEKMGPAYDTPTLLGVYRTAPYLHHGRAQTLAELLTRFNPEDRHGKTSHLSASQIDDLVQFLKALPFEDPVPQAVQLGIKKVE